ncbi:MAG: DUF1269 domain-containing protein [Thermoanaerobaculia bacterium]
MIVAGFADGHTAFLARAALARLQSKLSLPASDLAVITRAIDDYVSLQQIIDLGDETESHEMFWRALVNLLFAGDDSTDTFGEHATARLAEIGIDTTFRRRVTKIIEPETAAVLVLVSEPSTRDGVLAVLRGSRGEIARTTLVGDDRETWERAVHGRGESNDGGRDSRAGV